MIKGYKTWIGIAITVVGITGASKFITSDQMTEIVDITAKLIGIALTVYGNWDAHRKLSENNQ